MLFIIKHDVLLVGIMHVYSFFLWGKEWSSLWSWEGMERIRKSGGEREREREREREMGCVCVSTRERGLGER